jgi:hypothetical protein
MKRCPFYFIAHIDISILRGAPAPKSRLDPWVAFRTKLKGRHP